MSDVIPQCFWTKLNLTAEKKNSSNMSEQLTGIVKLYSLDRLA